MKNFLLFITIVFIGISANAQMKNDLCAGKKSDLINFNSAQDSVLYICMGNIVSGDSYVRMYQYSLYSTLTPDGENVLYANGMGGAGRYIKIPNQLQANWNETSTSSPSYIQNKPTVPSITTPTYNYGVSRTINSTSFTPSTTQPYRVTYNVSISCTASIGSSANGKVELQYFNGSAWVTVNEIANSNTVTLAVTLNSVNIQTVSISGEFPANTQLRLVPTVAGTTTITYIRGTEILY